MPGSGPGLWDSQDISTQVGVVRPGAVLDGHTARRIGTVQRTKWPLARSPAFLLRDKDDEVILRVARDVRKMSPTWSVFDGDGRTVGEILAAMQRYWKPDDIGASGSALIDGAVVAH